MHHPGRRIHLALNPDRNALPLSSRYVREFALRPPLLLLIIAVAVVIGLLYWFFRTELGFSLRATGANANIGPCPRHQHRCGEGPGAGGLQRPGGRVRRPSGPVLRSATIDTGRGAIIYHTVITLVLRLGLESTDLKLLTATGPQNSLCK